MTFKFQTSFCIFFVLYKGPDTDGPIELWDKNFNKLRWEFTLFTNLYQHPLISNQQQGLEMYEVARKYLDINELFVEVQQEIYNGQDFIRQQQQQKQTASLIDLQDSQIQQLQKIADLQTEQEKQRKESEKQTVITTLLTVVATVGLVFSIAVAIWSGYIAETSAARQNQYDLTLRWADRALILLGTIIISMLIIIISRFISSALKFLVDLIDRTGKKNE